MLLQVLAKIINSAYWPNVVDYNLHSKTIKLQENILKIPNLSITDKQFVGINYCPLYIYFFDSGHTIQLYKYMNIVIIHEIFKIAINLLLMKGVWIDEVYKGRHMEIPST